MAFDAESLFTLEAELRAAAVNYTAAERPPIDPKALNAARRKLRDAARAFSVASEEFDK